MKKANLRHNLEYYLPLLVIFAICLLTVYFTSDKKISILVTSLTAFLYFFWGIVHHRINHDLTSKIVIEYALVASLGMSIIFFILKGGFGL